MVAYDYSTIKRVKSTSEADLLDNKLVRCLALMITPLYAALKIYDLAKQIKKTFMMGFEGLLQAFIFIFCFGWFFKTPLFPMFKGLRCVRWLIYYKVHFHLLNLAAAALQAYFLRQFIPSDNCLMSWIVCLVIVGATVLASVWITSLHCMCILLLPVLATKHGRRFIATLLISSLVMGPIAKVTHNKNIIVRQMGCIAETSRNTSEVASQQMRERYEKMKESLEEIDTKIKGRVAAVQQKLDKMQDGINAKYSFLLNIIKKINAFVEKCERTMDKLKQKCADAFKCDKDKKRRSADDRWADEEDEIVDGDDWDEIIDDEELEKDEGYESVSEEAEIQKKPDLAGDDLKLKYDPYNDGMMAANTSLALYADHGNNHSGNHGNHGNHDYDRLHYGSVAQLRPRRGVWDSIVCFFKQIAGLIAKPICDLIFGFIKYLCKLPKLMVHFIDGVLLKKFDNMRRGIEGNLWINTSTTLVYEKQVVEVRSAELALREFRTKLEARVDIESPLWLSVFTYLRTLALLMIYISAMRYLNKYLKKASFDNLFINKELVKYNANQPTNIFPLKHRDWKKYMTVTQRSLLPGERGKVLQKVLHTSIMTFVTLGIEGLNIFLYYVVYIMYDYGPIRVEHILDLNKEGNAGLDKINITFDTTHCFQKPCDLDYDCTAYNIGLCLLSFCAAVTGVYIARWRHVICNRLYPAQAKARAKYIHSSIIRRRRAFFTNITEHLFQSATEHGLVQKLMPWLNKPQCVLCNGTKLIHKCDQCSTVYCTICLHDLNNVCNVCNEPAFRVKSSLILCQQIQSRHSGMSD